MASSIGHEVLPACIVELRRIAVEEMVRDALPVGSEWARAGRCPGLGGWMRLVLVGKREGVGEDGEEGNDDGWPEVGARWRWSFAWMCSRALAVDGGDGGKVGGLRTSPGKMAVETLA